MSLTYPDYIYTNFPDRIDTFDYFTDITVAMKPYADQYKALYNSGNIAGATAILEAHPELKKAYIGASTLNPIIDAVKAIEMFYEQDVQDYLMNIIQDKGDFSPIAKYSKYNVVGYYHNGATETYICYASNTPIGTLPTDTHYWRPITLRGEQGASGIGLSPRGAWNPVITYAKDSMVAYNNALWGSLIENINIAPTTTAVTTWYKIIEFNSDLLMFEDDATSIRYQLVVNNGKVFFSSTTGEKIDLPSKSVVTNETLDNTLWTGASAPYSYTLTVNGVTNTNIVEIVPQGTLTVQEAKAMARAMISTGTQSVNSITLYAFNTKPTIDLPITIVIRGDV